MSFQSFLFEMTLLHNTLQYIFRMTSNQTLFCFILLKFVKNRVTAPNCFVRQFMQSIRKLLKFEDHKGWRHHSNNLAKNIWNDQKLSDVIQVKQAKFCTHLKSMQNTQKMVNDDIYPNSSLQIKNTFKIHLNLVKINFKITILFG